MLTASYLALAQYIENLTQRLRKALSEHRRQICERMLEAGGTCGGDAIDEGATARSEGDNAQPFIPIRLGAAHEPRTLQLRDYLTRCRQRQSQRGGDCGHRSRLASEFQRSELSSRQPGALHDRDRATTVIAMHHAHQLTDQRADARTSSRNYFRHRNYL